MQCKDCEDRGELVILLPQDPFYVHVLGPHPEGTEQGLFLYQNEVYTCANCKTHFLLSTEIFPVKKPSRSSMKGRRIVEAPHPPTS